MHRALLALGLVCAALAWTAAASAGATVTTDRDLTLEVQTSSFDPCTNANDLTIAFAGLSTVHLNIRYQNGVAVAAHVDASETGVISTNVLGTDYVGFESYASKANLNDQNQVLDVHFAVAAISLDGTKSLAFDVEERVAFASSDPATPVSGFTKITATGCPA